MGFRSTLISEDVILEWPNWFRAKWDERLHFTGRYACIATKGEAKLYGVLASLALDIQRVITRCAMPEPRHFVFVALHECGGVSRCEITPERIAWTEPTGWERVEEPSHWYCYGCSDAAKAEPPA